MLILACSNIVALKALVYNDIGKDFADGLIACVELMDLVYLMQTVCLFFMVDDATCCCCWDDAVSVVAAETDDDVVVVSIVAC